MLRRTSAITALLVGFSLTVGVGARAAGPTPAKGQAASSQPSSKVVASQPVSATTQQARQRLKRGRELFARKDFEAALVQFEAAYKLRPTWRLLIFLGITELRLFHYGRAVERLREYLRQGGQQVTPAERAQVQKELAQLRATVAEVSVVVRGGPADVRVGDRLVGRSPLAQPLLLAPRPVKLSAVREGFDADVQSVTPKAGEQLTVTLTPRRQRALLAVDSKPRGASVDLDARERGRTPWQTRLPAGTYRLRLRLAGHLPHEETLTLDGRTPWQRAVVLDRRPVPAKRWYQRWYVWAAIGAVVVGATVGTVFGVREATRPSYTVAFGSNEPFGEGRL